MSTRANVVIKKSNKNGKVSYAQLYHHHDGYCSGLGNDLSEYMAEIKTMPDDERKKLLKDPVSLAKWFAAYERFDEFEYEGTDVNLHGDIEYLYVIDLTKKTVTCYSTWDWDGDIKDLDKVNGEAKQCDKYFMCYSVSMWQRFDKFKDKIREEWDGDEAFGSDDDDEEETSKYHDLDIKTLMDVVAEDADIATVLGVLEGYMTKQDLKAVLVEIAEKM